MTKKEAAQALKAKGISLVEVETLYKSLVSKAKALWKEDFILDEIDSNAPYLLVQLGVDSEGELMGRVCWHYSYMTAYTQRWYFASGIVSLTGEEKIVPILAPDYLYEDKYYQRTGKISQKSKDLAYSLYKSEMDNYFLPFENILSELVFNLN